MSAPAKKQHPPLIGNTITGITFSIYLMLCVINFNFSALVHGTPFHQTDVSMLIMTLLQPVAVAGFIAPFIAVARHSNFMAEFRSVFFIAVGCFVTYILWQMTGMMD